MFHIRDVVNLIWKSRLSRIASVWSRLAVVHEIETFILGEYE